MNGPIQETLSAVALDGAVLLFLKTTALLSAAWFVSFAFRKSSAALRHMVWATAMAGALCLPLLHGLMPGWTVVPETISLSKIVRPAGVAATALAATETGRAPAVYSAGEGPAAVAAPRRAGTADATVNWPALAAVLWLAGLCVVLARLWTGVLRTCRMVWRSTPPTTAGAQDALARCRRQLGVGRPVRVLVSRETAVPFVWGWRRPVVVLPAEAEDWDAERMRAVLSHELAHARRHDTTSVILAGLTVAVYWCHPLVWLADRKMKSEMERAADDCVLYNGTDSARYARHLLEIARGTVPAARFTAGVALARHSRLGGRVMDILCPRKNRTPLGAGRRMLVALAAIVTILPLASMTSHSRLADESVDPADRAAMVATLAGFYEALNAGEDYRIVAFRYLASAYFEPRDMTVETMDPSAWTAVFDNTLRIMTEEGLTGPFIARARLTSVRRDGDEYVMTLETGLSGPKLPVESVVREYDRVGIKVARDENGKPLPPEDAWVLRSHAQTVRFRNEDGAWKIAGYGDGLTIRRMDTDNPYGPIYLVWVEDLGPDVTPYGSMISKVIPAQFRPFNNIGVTFELED